MPDLSKKKSDAISAVVALAPSAIAFAAQIAELQGYLTDNGFLSGGNVFVDGDFVGDNAHTGATDFLAAVTTLGTLALSTGNRTALRKIEKKALAISGS